MNWLVAAVAFIIVVFGAVVFRGAPYVPSHRKYAKLALAKLYKLQDDDVLVDLGSGDGIVLRVAASLSKARIIGYELNPILVIISRILSRRYPHVETKLGDMWLADLPDETTVVYVFSVTRDIKKIEKKMQDLANRAGHEISVVTYGSPLNEKRLVDTLHAHKLYIFKPQ
jgi:hypothetical protein